MSKNLRNKLANLLDDIESLSKVEAVSKLERFMEEELELKQKEYQVTDHELTVISSAATDWFNKTPIHIGSEFAGDTKKLVALSYLQSVIGFFRSKGLINFTMSHRGKK